MEGILTEVARFRRNCTNLHLRYNHGTSSAVAKAKELTFQLPRKKRVL